MPASASRWSGPSGAGKSTLLRSLYGNYRADAGHILVRHQGEWWISRRRPAHRAAVRHDPSAMSASSCASCRACRRCDIVAEVLRGTRHAQAEARAATELLLRLNIPRRLHGLPPATFSGGEQQRVNLARGFIGGHPILLLDEPTASLDAANRAVVVAMIREAKARGHRHHRRSSTIPMCATPSPTGCSQVTPLQDAA